MGYFGELDSNLVVIKELCEDIQAKHEGKATLRNWRTGKMDYDLSKGKGILVDNYSFSGIPVVRIIGELGLEGKNVGKDHTYYSYEELLKFYPKTSEILLSIQEHRTKIRPNIDKLNKLYEEVEEEHKIAKQAIIQFART